MKYKFLSAIFLIFLLFPGAGSAADQEGLILSDEERSWLSDHTVLRVGNELDWPPFDFAEGGEARGYSLDLLRLIGEKAGLRFEFVNGFSWNELLT